MTKEEEDEVHRLVQSVGVVQLSRIMFKGMDVSEMINVIILAGRGYSVKLLTWLKYYCEVMPLFIMLFHIACMVTFASHEKKCAYGLWRIGYRQHLSIFPFTSIRLCL